MQGPRGTQGCSPGAPSMSLRACSEPVCGQQGDEEGLCCSEIVTLNQQAQLAGRGCVWLILFWAAVSSLRSGKEDNVTHEKGQALSHSQSLARGRGEDTLGLGGMGQQLPGLSRLHDSLSSWFQKREWPSLFCFILFFSMSAVCSVFQACS